MCGRFTLTFRERQELADAIGVDVSEIPPDYKPRWNIPPTDPHLIVRIRFEDREVLPAKWGLVNYWAKDAKKAAQQINARAETLARTPAFREAFKKRRCVVPADGFYEWVGVKETRQPVWFHRRDSGLFLFAGLYESWQPTPEEWQRTFTIITTTPNAVTSRVHDRMPVILTDEAAIEDWLNPRHEEIDQLLPLLRPAPDDFLTATPVSQRANSVRNDDPACLEPADLIAAPRLL